MTTIEMLRERLTTIRKKDEPAAVCSIMQWLHERDHAVCIFTSKELATSSLSLDDVESAMCTSGDDAIRFNPVHSESADD